MHKHNINEKSNLVYFEVDGDIIHCNYSERYHVGDLFQISALTQKIIFDPFYLIPPISEIVIIEDCFNINELINFAKKHVFDISKNKQTILSKLVINFIYNTL